MSVKIKLRDYQQAAIDMTMDWFRKNKEGHPCVVMPCGSGKSVCIAEMCRYILSEWPYTRILMLVHSKELIQQNADKMKAIWPDAPLGIYSAGLKSRELDQPIIFAGIQSIRKKAEEVGHVDIVICDECQAISHKEEGGYRTFINGLMEINPALRVVGYTASPLRLGHGYIHEGDALFDDLIEPVTIEELLANKYLAPLRSKATSAVIDVEGVKVRGGDYVERDLQAAVDQPLMNREIVEEVIKRAEDRKAWMFFCTGVEHAQHMAQLLCEYGIAADCVTGDLPIPERDRIINQFKAGELRALTSVMVLTTGFDYPNIDLIAMCRPTMSPIVHIQTSGRGMRLKEHTDHCLFLDFAGVVKMHGPITAIRPPPKKGERRGDAPTKVCEQCHEICHLSVKECPACGASFTKEEDDEEKALRLHDDDIMGGFENDYLKVSQWSWEVKRSSSNGKEMLFVRYYGEIWEKPINEYMTIFHDGYAGRKARKNLASMLGTDAKQRLKEATDMYDIVDTLNEEPPPCVIIYTKEGKFYNIKKRLMTEYEADKLLKS